MEWFLPRAEAMRNCLKPAGSFVLNIKEKAENGERHTYVLELILALRKQGWLWVEEYVWHKKNAVPGNGRTASATRGSGCCISPRPKNSK